MDTCIVWTPSEGRQTARHEIPGAPRGGEHRPRAPGLNVHFLANRPGRPSPADNPPRDSQRRERGLWEMAAQTFHYEPPSVYALSSWQQTSRGSRKASPPDLESTPILSTSAGVGLPTSAQTSIKCYC